MIEERENIVIPSWVRDFAWKLVAIEEASGLDNLIQTTAYEYYKKREELNIPGSPDMDWRLAEEVVWEKYTQEVYERLAKGSPV
jgi:hypothetical protein